MGEVYLAEDTKLDRQVALKILPAELAGDSERRARFEREAKAVASLNHPNIVTIHSVEEDKGFHFLTMEMVHGKSLSELIPEGGLALTRFFDFATPLADAVSTAHQNGVTHRDLKPDNIMMGDDGRLRVLDFGLAKLAETASGEEGPAEAPTQSVTQEGKVLGTVAYMSPEQAEGKPVDHRSDIFSLGIILYEMATGQRPFKGDTSLSVLSSILRDTPSSVTDLNTRLPRQLGRIVRRCLQKEPNRRYQSALDLRNELEELQEEVATGEVTPVGQEGVPAAEGGWKKLLMAAALIVGVLGLGFGLWSLMDRQEESAAPEVSSFESMQIRPLTSTGNASLVAISPDGKYVAYVDDDGRNRTLRVKQVATGSDVEIVSPGNIWFNDVRFSHDGDYVFYVVQPEFDAPGELYQVPTLGGTPRKLLEDIATGVGLSPDGSRVVYLKGTGGNLGNEMWVARLDGGQAQQVASVAMPKIFFGTPAWSPTDDLLVNVLGDASDIKAQLWGVPADGGDLKALAERRWGGIGKIAWHPDGSGLVFTGFEEGFSGWQLFEMAYPSAEVRRITNDLNDYQGVSLTADGNRLATVLGDQHASLWVQAVDGSTRRRQIETTTGTANGAGGVTWTVDGKIVYTADEGTESHLWLMNADGGEASRLTLRGLEQHEPATHPDGESVIFDSLESDRISIWSIRLDGTGLEELTPDVTFGMRPAISPDGEWLFYNTVLEGDFQMVRRSLVTGQVAVVLTGDCHTPSWSPDGSRMALHFRGEGERRWKTGILTPDGSELLESHDFHSESQSPWGGDGRSLFHSETRDGVGNIFLMPLDGGEPRQVTDFTEGEIFHFDVSSDGSTLVIAQGRQLRDIVLIDNFR
jgi:serine/threonine protein kinase